MLTAYHAILVTDVQGSVEVELDSGDEVGLRNNFV